MYRVVTRYVFHRWSLLYLNCWYLISKARQLLFPDPTNMIQAVPWSLTKLLIPWLVIPDLGTVIPDPILPIPDPSPLIPYLTYLVTTVTCKQLDFKGFYILVTWLSKYGRDTKKLRKPSIEQTWPKFQSKLESKIWWLQVVHSNRFEVWSCVHVKTCSHVRIDFHLTYLFHTIPCTESSL